MKLLDRDFQKRMLLQLAEGFPSKEGFIFDMCNPKSMESVNYHYLEGHGLVEIEKIPQALVLSKRHTKPRQGPTYTNPGRVRITVKGMDFVESDGGLTAILGVITVKFHQETLSELETMIQLSKDLPEKEKTNLLQKLRSLPDEGAKTLAQELVKAGLRKAPDGWNTAISYLNSIPWN